MPNSTISKTYSCHGLGCYRTGPLVIWDPSWRKINSTAYVNHITQPVLSPFYETETHFSWPYCTYVMQDGAPAHRAKHTQAEEKKLGIIRLDWPASSPDLNPIETLWRTMKKRLDNLPIRPASAPAMIEELQKMWAELIPVIDFVPHITSMPARIKAVIAANGGHTKY